MIHLPRSLFGRLALVQIAFGIAVAFLFALIIGLTHDRFHLESTQRQGVDWADRIADRYRETLVANASRGERLRPLLETLEQNNPAARFYVVAGDGEILAASIALGSLARPRLDTAPIVRLRENDSPLPILIEDPIDARGYKIFSAASISAGELPGAYFLMVLRTPQPQTFLATHANYLLSDSLLVAAGVTTPALATAVLLLFMILRPIRRLSATITALEQTQNESGATTASGRARAPTSELDELGHHFDQMATRIADLMRRQQDEDRQRWQMFGNLAHDLRTPLSVIAGCLETLRDDDRSLAAGEAQHMLRLAHGQSRALKRLVESIFELATLHSPDYPLQREAFPIAELIHDVAAKFSAIGRRHGVAVVVDIALADRDWKVDADVFLIERVLDNLIDNAIRHAHGASRISIELRSASDTVEVSVSDDGHGLPTEMLADSAEYTAGPKRGRSSGRGLRIVRRILELHQSTLTSSRIEPAGSRLAFSLPCTAPPPAPHPHGNSGCSPAASAARQIP